jgi:hypothetical protein
MEIGDRHGIAATASEVRDIVGGLDDGVIASIAALGATCEEIAEAQAWLTSDDYLHRELHHTLSGRAAQVFDILEAQLPEPDEPR